MVSMHLLRWPARHILCRCVQAHEDTLFPYTIHTSHVGRGTRTSSRNFINFKYCTCPESKRDCSSTSMSKAGKILVSLLLKNSVKLISNHVFILN